MKQKPLKAKTREQIADEYGICSKTLRRWLKKNEIQLPHRLISPKDQLKIYETFGFPDEFPVQSSR